jgi:RNA polymerase sigma factor (sigma-70 family)
MTSTLESDIIDGLRAGGIRRRLSENKLFETFSYFVNEGVRKFRLDRDDAAGAYADAVLAVVGSIHNGGFEQRASLKTFLFQIFSNKCVDLTRKKTTNKGKVHQGTVWIDELPLPDESRNFLRRLMDASQLDIVKARIAQLGEKCQTMLLRWGEGYSDSEIASELGYNTEAVAKTSRLRCLQKLRESSSSSGA